MCPDDFGFIDSYISFLLPFPLTQPYLLNHIKKNYLRYELIKKSPHQFPIRQNSD